MQVQQARLARLVRRAPPVRKDQSVQPDPPERKARPDRLVQQAPPV
jgi:hypothetical protein